MEHEWDTQLFTSVHRTKGYKIYEYNIISFIEILIGTEVFRL